MDKFEEEVTVEESGILAIIRYNIANPPTEINKTIVIRRLKINFNWRSKKNLWGRFGGGWNWQLGFIASGNTIILNVLVFSLRFYWMSREVNK